ncbi:hypothetical protein GEMRC1_013878 [Eukaryota sp. GEM-RC1]
MSSKTKKRSSRFKLFIAYTCDTLFGSGTLVHLVLLFLYAGLIASAAFSILIKSKAISFASFITGNLIFWYVTFSSSFKKWLESLNSQLKPVLFYTRVLYTPFFLHNLFWFWTYLSVLYLASYFYPVDPFPVSEQLHVCLDGNINPYSGVPWGDLSIKFLNVLLAALGFQITLTGSFYIIVIAPIVAVVDLYKHFKKNFDSDSFLLDASSSQKDLKLSQFVFGIDIRGRLSYLFLMYIPISHLIVFSFIWPSEGVRFFLQIVLATYGLFSLIVVICSFKSILWIKRQMLLHITFTYTLFIDCCVMVFCVLVLGSILGWVSGYVYFLVDPMSTSFILISKTMYDAYPSKIDLLMCLLSFLVFAAVLTAVVYLFVFTVTCLFKCCKGFQEYEQKILKSDDEKNVQYC